MASQPTHRCRKPCQVTLLIIGSLFALVIIAGIFGEPTPNETTVQPTAPTNTLIETANPNDSDDGVGKLSTPTPSPTPTLSPTPTTPPWIADTTPSEVLQWSVTVAEDHNSLGRRFNFEYIQEVVYGTEGAIYGDRAEWIITQADVGRVCQALLLAGNSILDFEALIWDRSTWEEIAILGALYVGLGKNDLEITNYCQQQDMEYRSAPLKPYATPGYVAQSTSGMTDQERFEEFRKDECFVGRVEFASSYWYEWDPECQRNR